MLVLSLATACGAKAAQKAPKAAGASNVVVMTGDESSISQDPPAQKIRLNQAGYLPAGPKFATVGSDSKEPLDWELVDDKGSKVASGKTKPFGLDADSGDAVHQIDFSSFKGTGKGLSLKVGSDKSYPFDVRADLYKQLKQDAVWFFYHQRSGIAIEMPYAGDKKWARPAAHLSDKKVPCAKDAGCTYELDVTGGWYDAGDHGKYVVNGGISAWTLLALYERLNTFGKASLADFGDGKLRVPEKGNKVPDLLDEARWEVDFLLKMQVPEGQPLAGMAHHKMHDTKWTGIGQIPPAEIKSDNPRILRPPSTAATLNLAAVGAQAARIYKPFDAAFSKKCLEAAERAWKAAKANPSKFAEAKDTVGGGPYDDKRVTDEFYWAATELFITTGKPEYKTEMLASPFHNKIPNGSDETGKGVMTPFTWQSVSAAGTISLTLAQNQLPAAEIAAAKKEIQRHADAYLGMISKSGYRVPLLADQSGYPWGSNSFIINNALAMTLAYDFTKEQKYLSGAIDALDYVLGNNAMGRSYVTGWGSFASKNPHHRFWAHQEFADYPEPPPGILVGGPNSGLQDPITEEAKLDGCKPMKCYIDHIGAWSLNEVTINWNSPLVWVAAVVDENAK
jgi:endoglucanase